MGLNIRDRFRINACQRLSHRHGFRLSFHSRRAETHTLRTVIIKPDALNNGVNLVPVFNGIFQALQYHDADTVAERCSLSLSVERPRMSVRRSNIPFVVVVTTLLRNSYGHAAGQSHVALKHEQRLASLPDGHKRSRTSRS